MGNIEKSYIGPFTHSRIRDAETCKLQFKLRHIDKLDGKSSPAMERGSTIHENIEAYLNGWIKKLPVEVSGLRSELLTLKKQKPIIEQLWAHDIEFKPLADGFDKTAYCRAKLDSMVVEKDRVRVIDFKSGRKYPANDDQVRFYGMLGLMRAPTVNLAILELWYVDQNEIVVCDPVTRGEVTGLMKDFKKRATKMYALKTFPAEPGLHCRTCPFSRSKGGVCPV